MKVITNNHSRDVLSGWELSNELSALDKWDDFKKEFNYIDWDDVESGTYDVSFVKYKGDYIDITEFGPTHMFDADHPFRKWDAHQTDSFFSGLVIRYVPGTDLEQVVVGRYYS